jgi:hypothetical protein
MRHRWFAIALAVAVLAPRARAIACATCSCGDPTLTATGVEQPYKNRLRVAGVAVEERYDSHAAGDPSYGDQTWSLRSGLLVTWSPLARLTLGAFLPWVTTWIMDSHSTLSTVNGLGDLELSARVVAFRDRKFAPHHLLWGSAGLKMPTGPFQRDAEGYPISDDDQPGSGSWDPFFGATYAWFSGGLASLFAATTYRLATAGRHNYQRGSSLSWSAAVQLQPFTWGAILIGLDGHWATPDRLNGHEMPDSGGVVARFAPGLLFAPRTDLTVRLNVAVPIVQALYGNQHDGTQVLLSMAYDIR